MATRAAGRKTQDAYFELVKEFPLVPIRNDAHLACAEAVMHRLLQPRTGRRGAGLFRGPDGSDREV